jgi:hypothetical protein
MPTIQTVNTIDPATLSDFERSAIDEFVRTAHANGDKAVTCLDRVGCGLFLVGEAAAHYGEDLPCLAVVCDELGNWTALIRRPQTAELQRAAEYERTALLTCQFIGGKDVR